MPEPTATFTTEVGAGPRSGVHAITGYVSGSPTTACGKTLKYLYVNNWVEPGDTIGPQMTCQRCRKFLLRTEDVKKTYGKTITAVARPRLYHITNSQSLVLDVNYLPQGANGIRHNTPGLFLTSNPEYWNMMWGPKQYAIEFDVSALGDRDCYELGTNDDQWLVPARAFDKVEVRRVWPIQEAIREGRRAGFMLAMVAPDIRDGWSRDNGWHVLDHRKGWGSVGSLCGEYCDTDGQYNLSYTTRAWLLGGHLMGSRLCAACKTKLARQR